MPKQFPRFSLTVLPLYLLGLSHPAMSYGLSSNTISLQPTKQEQLTNQTIVKLVKAGLSDEVIITMIQRSPTNFALDTEAIVQLKQANVSNSIIEAMLRASTPSPAPAATSAAQPSLTPGPTAYGCYVLDGTRLADLPSAQVITTLGLQIGDRGMAVDGFRGDPHLNVNNSLPLFIVYQQTVDVSNIHLAGLEHIESMKAHQFNILGTNPAFFSNIYRRGYNDTIPVDLWRPRAEMARRVEPVPERPGMYRLFPTSALAPGRYTLYFGSDLHASDIVFTASPGRQASAFYFSVGLAPVGASSVPAANPIIGDLTKDDEDTQVFPIHTKEVAQGFDETWSVATQALTKQKEHIEQSNKAAGVIATTPTRHGVLGFPNYDKYVLLIERIDDQRTRLTLKLLSWYPDFKAGGVRRPQTRGYLDKKAREFLDKIK